jgi:outer membrane protein
VTGQWSIWEGGRQSAQTAEARSRVDAAAAMLAEAREQVAVEIARQQLEVRRARAAAAAAETHLQQAEESFRVTRQQYDEGAALSAEVLDAEQSLRRARARRMVALADYEIARAAVRRTTGEVW